MTHSAQQFTPLAYWRLLRPSHWIKSAVVGGALIFSGRALDSAAQLRTLGAIAVFCALASLVYIINDIQDRESDRAHPIKKFRPLAAEKVSLSISLALAVALALVGTIGAIMLGTNFTIIALGYVGINLLYSWRLKRVVVLDVMIIATGFILRAWAGAVAIDVRFDAGLSIGAFLLALFLALGKRRHELTLLGDKSAAHRISLDSYTPAFLDQLIVIVTSSVVVTYILYVSSSEIKTKLGTEHLWITFPFVLFGVFRYLFLVHNKEGGGSPTTILFTDLHIIIDVLLWLGVVAALLYM